MIQIVINDIDESQNDIFTAAITAAQNITHETKEDVQIIYDGENIIETYIDWIPEIEDYDVMTWFCHHRFLQYEKEDTK